MSTNKRVYFPNLDGVRFLAALVVIIHHVEMAKYWFGLPNIYRTSFVGGVFGQLGIILFFVLSGFLITYLLLEEHKQTGKISIKDFYIRRILRIWPVYYLIVILSLFVFPKIAFLYLPGFSEYINDGFALKSVLYLTFFSNLAYTMYEHVPYATQTWSVGVEEQFYLIWPVIVHFALKKNRLLPALIGTIVVYLVIKTAAIIPYAQNMQDLSAEKTWLFWDHFSIDCMAIGGIGAYILFYKKEQILKVLFNKYLQIALYATLAIITVKGIVLPWYNKEWYALIFVVLILNLAANPRSVLNLEYKPLNYLGKISYGLYMYHNLVLIVLLKVIMKYDLVNVSSISGGIAYQLLSLGLTVVVSALSYQYFEKWFLKAKNRFAKVKSGGKLAVRDVPLLPDNQQVTPVPAQ